MDGGHQAVLPDAPERPGLAGHPKLPVRVPRTERLYRARAMVRWQSPLPVWLRRGPGALRPFPDAVRCRWDYGSRGVVVDVAGVGDCEVPEEEAL